jgi:hypothetical protein
MRAFKSLFLDFRRDASSASCGDLENGISVGENGSSYLRAPRYDAISPRRKCVTAVIGPAILQDYHGEAISAFGT